jgi:hypothetical protein
MTRLLILLTLLFGILDSRIANAVEVWEADSAIAADVHYVVTPKAEADWLIYRAKRASEAPGGVIWYFTKSACGATAVKAVPKAEAKAKVFFVTSKGEARCKRKCDRLP